MFASEMLAMLVGLLALSILTREPALFLMAMSLLAAAGISRLWERFCLDKVEYRRHLSSTLVCHGEKVELETETINRKILPLSWLEVEDRVSSKLDITSAGVPASSEGGAVRGLSTMRPYERVRRHYSINCDRRGEFLFGPAVLRSGDLFGFVTRELLVRTVDSLVVYPRLIRLDEMGLPSRQPLGDLKAQSWIFEDTSRTAGAREYRPGDSLRRIHWSASARAQKLQSRSYEATTRQLLAVFLDVSAPLDGGDVVDRESTVEFTISCAASLAVWALQQHYQVGVFANGSHRGQQGAVIVEPAGDPRQEERIMIALGRLKTSPVAPVEELLRSQRSRLPLGSTVAVVSAAPSNSVVTALSSLARGGWGTVLLVTGPELPAVQPSRLLVRHIAPATGPRAEVLQEVG